MKICIVLLSLIFFFFLTNSITNSQEAVTPAGGDGTGTGGSVSFTIGQIVYTTNSNINGTVSQGVQQTYKIITIGIEYKTNDNISLSVFPNPTENELNLQVTDADKNKYNYQISDLQGKILEGRSILSERTLINMALYPSAPYFIKVLSENNILKIFKIIKR